MDFQSSKDKKKIEKPPNISRKQYQKWSTMNLIKSCER